MNQNYRDLIRSIQQCQICNSELAHSPKPIFQLHPKARILIAGQAPGRRAHESGIPFDDPSGDRLREWMGVTKEVFYDASRIAILPMGFCYPGNNGSADLPPRSECAQAWRVQALQSMPQIELTLVIGSYAMEWHLAKSKKCTLTETVKAWQDHMPEILPLPHPSPRNNFWLRKNAWFEQDVLPVLRARILKLIN